MSGDSRTAYLKSLETENFDEIKLEREQFAIKDLVELFTVDYTKEEFPVDGKRIWAALEVPTPSNKWLPRKIEQYGFKENFDFVTNLSMSENNRVQKEYRFSIAAAEHLSMITETEKGKEIREFFRDCKRSDNGVFKN